MHQTLQQLRQLKLSGMAHALQTQQEQVGTYEGLAFMDRMQLLLDEESLARDQNKQQRLIRQAKFKLHATLNDIDYQHRRNITKTQIAEFGKGMWIERGQNIAITGPCGSGKTYLACALGHNACLKLFLITTHPKLSLSSFSDIGGVLSAAYASRGMIAGKSKRRLKRY